MKKKKVKRIAGLSLIEVLAVVAIIGVIMAVALPKVLADIERVNVQADKENVRMLDGAVKQFRLDTGSVPQQLDHLMVNPGVPGWEGPYLERLPESPAGKSYSIDPATGKVNIL